MADEMMMVARIAELEGLLRECGEQFRFYEASHLSKIAPGGVNEDAQRKADVNRGYADRCAAMLRDEPNTLDQQIEAAPQILFRRTGGGYRAELGEGRAVELRRGEDDKGQLLYALRTDNQGSRIDLTFSGDAMDAITRIYCELIVDDFVAVAEDASAEPATAS